MYPYRLFPAYYGILFPGREEAAFSNFRLWESVGYIIAYVISPYFRTSTKTYTLFIMMIVGVAAYFTVEFREHKVKKKLEEKNKELNPEKGCDNGAFECIERFWDHRRDVYVDECLDAYVEDTK